MFKAGDCPLCHSPSREILHTDVGDYEYSSTGSADYWTCCQCEVVFQFPLPNDDRLAQAYPADYHAYSQPVNAVLRSLKGRYWKRKASLIGEVVRDRGPVLDIGCGNGDMLQALHRQGYEKLVGLDFNKNALEKVRNAGFEAHHGELHDAQFPSNYFSAIILTNFIEHVPDPVSTLKSCRQLLRPGGIVFGETPNIDCWDFRLFGKHWGGYHAPRHFVLFSKRTLWQLGENAGLQVEDVRNMVQPSHWATSVQNWLSDSRVPLQITGGRSFLFGPLLLGLTPVNLIQTMISDTTSMEFIFRKPDH